MHWTTVLLFIVIILIIIVSFLPMRYRSDRTKSYREAREQSPLMSKIILVGVTRSPWMAEAIHDYLLQPEVE